VLLRRLLRRHVRPVSNIVVPIGTIMAERLLYLPPWAFCLLLAATFDALGRWSFRAPRAIDAVAYGAAVLMVVPYAGGTIVRSQVWNDRLRFFEAMVRDAPRSARSHRELGLTYGDLGRYDRALEEMHTSLEIEPDDPITLYDLGNVHLRAGRYEDAVAAYSASLAAAPNSLPR